MNVEGELPHVYLLAISDRTSQGEIKEMGNMFISLPKKNACWRFKVPAGH